MWSPGLAPLRRTTLSGLADHRHRNDDVAGLGQVAADEDDARRPAGFLETGEELDDPVERDIARERQAQDSVERAPAHGGDVADVDVEALAAEKAGILERQDEIVVLDEEVLGHEKPPRARLENGRVVPDADEDVLPRDGEVPADDRQELPLAELAQSHVRRPSRRRLKPAATMRALPGLAFVLLLSRPFFAFVPGSCRLLSALATRAWDRTSLTSST